MGSFDQSFLAIPPEVIRTTIRNNQKCFVLRDPKSGAARQRVHPRLQHRGRGRRQGDRRRQRARDPRAAVGCEVLLRDRPEDAAGRAAAEVRADRVPREARHPGRADRAHRAAGGRDRADGRRRRREGEARGDARQGRSADRSGRRISRIAGPDGEILRAGTGRGRGVARGDRGSLQAARPGRSRADRSGGDRGRARRQDRHAGRLLGDRREADRIEGPVRAASRGARRDPHVLRTMLRFNLGATVLRSRPQAISDRAATWDFVGEADSTTSRTSSCG